MPKFVSRVDFVGAALYPGATAQTHRGKLWDVLRAALGLTDVNRVTVTATSALTVLQCGVLLVDATAGDIVLTFPASGVNTDEANYNVVRVDGSAYSVSVVPAGADTVNGIGAAYIPQRSSMQFWMPAGFTDWRIVGQSGSTPTGARCGYLGATAPVGWVLASGRTIGSAASGATERANADTQALFALLWNSMANTEAPVSGGRGASAAADFAANKTMTLPDWRGRTGVGKDNMGGTAANRITNAGSGIVGTTLGASGGGETHTLTIAQMPQHNHANAAVFNQGVTPGGSTLGGYDPGGGYTGGNGAHNNTQPSYIENVIIKL